MCTTHILSIHRVILTPSKKLKIKKCLAQNPFLDKTRGCRAKISNSKTMTISCHCIFKEIQEREKCVVVHCYALHMAARLFIHFQFTSLAFMGPTAQFINNSSRDFLMRLICSYEDYTNLRKSHKHVLRNYMYIFKGIRTAEEIKLIFTTLQSSLCFGPEFLSHVGKSNNFFAK